MTPNARTSVDLCRSRQPTSFFPSEDRALMLPPPPSPRPCESPGPAPVPFLQPLPFPLCPRGVQVASTQQTPVSNCLIDKYRVKPDSFIYSLPNSYICFIDNFLIFFPKQFIFRNTKQLVSLKVFWYFPHKDLYFSILRNMKYKTQRRIYEKSITES